MLSNNILSEAYATETETHITFLLRLLIRLTVKANYNSKN